LEACEKDRLSLCRELRRIALATVTRRGALDLLLEELHAGTSERLSVRVKVGLQPLFEVQVLAPGGECSQLDHEREVGGLENRRESLLGIHIERISIE